MSQLHQHINYFSGLSHKIYEAATMWKWDRKLTSSALDTERDKNLNYYGKFKHVMYQGSGFSTPDF